MIYKSILIFLFIANLGFAGVIEIALEGQAIWKGEIGYIVEAEYINSRGRSETVVGTITKFEDDYLIIDKQFIFLADLSRIATLEIPIKETEENIVTKTEKEIEEPKKKQPNRVQRVRPKNTTKNESGYIVIDLNDGFTKWGDYAEVEYPLIDFMGQTSPLLTRYVNFYEVYINENAIQAVLDYHFNNKSVKDIVFVIKSPGGSVSELERIRELIAPSTINLNYHHTNNEFNTTNNLVIDTKYEDRYTFHCVINEKAFSAAMMFAYLSENIFVFPGSSGGACVGFRGDINSGSAEVDAKLTSGLAGEYASAAERNGHNSLIVRPMIVMEECLYSWKDNEGKLITSADEPQNKETLKDYRQWVNEEEVLTLTAMEMEELNVAKVIRSIIDIGVHLNRDNWYFLEEETIKSKKIREQIHKRVQKDFWDEKDKGEKFLREVSSVLTLANEIPYWISIAEDAHPDRYNDYEENGGYYGGTWQSTLTLESKRLWNKRLNIALEHWRGIANYACGVKEHLSLLERNYYKNIFKKETTSPYQLTLREAQKVFLDDLYTLVKLKEGELRMHCFNANSKISSIQLDYKN